MAAIITGQPIFPLNKYCVCKKYPVWLFSKCISNVKDGIEIFQHAYEE